MSHGQTNSTFEKTYGTGNAPSIFEHGKSGKTFCVGEKKQIIGNIYGLKIGERKIPIEDISFCEYCAKKLPQEMIYKHDYCAKTCYDKWYYCDIYYTDKLREYGMDERCLHYDGYRVNVNIVDPNISQIWRPTTKLSTRPKTADKDGLLITNIPSGSHYEVAITTDPMYYNDDYSFKIESMKFGDGKVVTYSTVDGVEGYSNLYHDQNSKIMAYVSSYHSLKDNMRFYFQRMTQKEVTGGMIPGHYNKSNKIFIKLGLYKIIHKPRPIYRSRIVSDSLEDDCCTKGGDVQYRGSKSSNLGGGATYSTNGSAFKINATAATKEYSKYPFKITEVSIQLVNDESEEQIAKVSSEICEIAKKELTEKLASIEERQKTISGHKTQESHMYKF